MAAGDPIFRGITSSTDPVLQEGSFFTDQTYGLDTGRRSFIVHPGLSTASWPQRGDADDEYSSMFVEKVTPKNHESTLIELEVEYVGQTSAKEDKLTPSSDTSVFSYAADGIGTDFVQNVNVQVPVPVQQREYVVFTEPDQDGVGNLVSGSPTYLYTPGDFNFVFSSTTGVSRNYFIGWVLTARQIEVIIPGEVWFVTENFHYFYALA